MTEYRIYPLDKLGRSTKGIIMNCELEDKSDGIFLERRAATHDLLRERIHGGLTDEEMQALRGEE